MKFLLMLLSLLLMSALPACNAPPGCAQVSAADDALSSALPVAMPMASFVGVDLQAAPTAADLTSPSTLSQAALPFVLRDLAVVPPETMPADAEPRRDTTALQRLRPRVLVTSAVMHGWQRTSPRHC